MIAFKAVQGKQPTGYGFIALPQTIGEAAKLLHDSGKILLIDGEAGKPKANILIVSS